jgi:hypothetical protein
VTEKVPKKRSKSNKQNGGIEIGSVECIANSHFVSDFLKALGAS